MSSPDRVRVIGPSLRPDDVAPASGIGPAIPVEVFRSKLEQDNSVSQQDELEDLSTIGPLIPGQELGEELRHFRPDQIADAPGTISSTTTTGLKRESWMTQLLPVSNTNVAALKARKFQRSVGGSGDGGCDRSWFKTPTDGASATDADPDVDCVKQESLTNCEKLRESAYNQQMSEIVNKCQTKTTPTSLLELHRQKLEKKMKKKEKKKNRKDEEGKTKDKDKKKSKKKEHKSKHKEKHHKRHRSSSPESAQPMRQPFDRDKDLKISRIDSAARHALIERSKQLSSRFGHGSRQFL